MKSIILKAPKYTIITKIDGIKQYLRRYKIRANGYVCPTMVTVNKGKSVSFSKEKATDMLSRLGIGYAIEPIG